MRFVEEIVIKPQPGPASVGHDAVAHRVRRESVVTTQRFELASNRFIWLPGIEGSKTMLAQQLGEDGGIVGWIERRHAIDLPLQAMLHSVQRFFYAPGAETTTNPTAASSRRIGCAACDLPPTGRAGTVANGRGKP
jgi:hypothetical protein